MESEPPWRDLALEEYRALRAEVVASLQGQLQGLALGTAAIGVLAAGGFSVWNDAPFAAAAVFLVGVPALALASLFVWTGELTRMKRAGVHLRGLELELKRIHPDLPPRVFSWEGRLSGGDRPLMTALRRDWKYLPVGAVLAAIALGSHLVGRERVRSGDDPGAFPFFASNLDLLLAVTAAVVLLSLALAVVQVVLAYRPAGPDPGGER